MHDKWLPFYCPNPMHHRIKMPDFFPAAVLTALGLKRKGWEITKCPDCLQSGWKKPTKDAA